MYYFMYRFISSDFEDKAYKQVIPLALCGLSFGFGIASKWTGFYAAAGLVALYIIYIIMQGKKLCSEGKYGVFALRLTLILVVSIAFFVAAPAIIYYLSYIPYAAGLGKPLSPKIVWENQTGMLNYHIGVNSTHSYASRWWMWIFDIRPILYYLEYPAQGYHSSFGAFLNPVVCWGGLVALLSLLWRQIRRRANGISLFILIGYAAQLIPWIPITRITFAYHYFPSVVFLVLALSYTADEFMEKAPQKKYLPYTLCAVSVFLFILFYPALTGLTIPDRFSQLFLKWLPSWPF
jgi:dolichyl-phosphate-mannose--protein O-mannosyl transferase